MDEHLKNIARQAIQQAQQEGLDEEDAYWMSVGALVSEGRKQGAIGEELSPEMNAALQELVKREMSPQ